MKRAPLIAGSLLFALALCRGPAQQSTNSPITPARVTVSSSEVDAFLAKWKPVIEKEGFLGATGLTSETNALAKVLGALDREPTGLWTMYLRIMLESPPGTPANAQDVLNAWKQASVSLTRASKDSSEKPEIAECLQLANQSLAKAALEAGQLAEASTQAAALLAHNSKGWNYGNIIYDAHSILGRVALRQGNLAQARQELLEAGRTPGSPQLNSFGPRFTLARELLEKQEKGTVLQFLDLVAQFWANPDAASEGNAKTVAIRNRAKLDQWKQQIGSGKIPDDHRWL